MSGGFGMLIEDPFYDEDGVLIDEDADWTDAAVDEFEAQQYSAELENFDPFETVNS